MRKPEPDGIGRLRVPLIVLMTTLVLGSLGYVLIEGWSVADALFMSVTTVTTVGYGETHPLSTAGRMFSIFLIVTGVGSISYVLTSLAATLFEGYANQRWERRRMSHRVAHLADHHIICGYGRVGREIAAQLRRERCACLVVDISEVALGRATKDGFPVVEGNASEDDTLRRAGIIRARGLITAVATDAENIFITLSARALKAGMPIVARANFEDAVSKLRRAGATQVVSPYAMAGQQMARLAARPTTVGFVERLLEGSQGELMLEEIHVAPGSPISGTTIGDARQHHAGAAVILAVQRGGHLFSPPAADLRIDALDTLAVVGSDRDLNTLAIACQSRSEPVAVPNPVQTRDGQVATAP